MRREITPAGKIRFWTFDEAAETTVGSDKLSVVGIFLRDEKSEINR